MKMTISDEISVIANKLANEGKKPSIALIKTRLSKPVPLPSIIQVLKAWQHQPEFIALPQEQAQLELNKEVSVDEEQARANHALINMMEQAVNQAMKPLQTEIAQLKMIIKKLEKKLE